MDLSHNVQQNGEVGLRWDKVPSALNYLVEVSLSESSGCHAQNIAIFYFDIFLDSFSVAADNVVDTEVLIRNLENDTNYIFRVKARNSAGISEVTICLHITLKISLLLFQGALFTDVVHTPASVLLVSLESGAVIDLLGQSALVLSTGG